ncbi:MAG TPA: Calx-beta domain-containing protein, partial [Phormidium sp.]
MTKIIINEFYRGGNLITGDEFIELLLLEDLTATQLQSFFVGDSTASKASKSSAYQFTNMSTIATTFKAGTIIAVGGTGRIIQDTSYNPAGGDWNILLNAGNNSFLPNVGSSFGDLAADDIAWVDTSSTGATISADGFAVDIGTASGAFTSAVNVNFEASTNNTGYALNSDLAGATNTANWTTGIATASTTPGLPNGGANTTYIDSLRVTLPTVTIAATDANAAEAGLDPGTFRITRTGSTTNALAVSYTIGGQAANGTDYNPNLTGTATIAAGQSFVDITITPVNDSTAEGNETLTLDLVDTADYDLGATSKATVAIADNDTAGITITQSGDRTNVTEGGATDSYTVVLNTQPTAIVTININPDAQTTTNTNSLTFTPNNWNIAQNVTVTAVDDAAVEGNHTGTISHTATSIDNNYNGINIASLTANITDNDVAAPPTVNLSVSSNAGTEAGTKAITVTATAQSAVTGDQTVDLGVSGTNITPGDYNLSNTTITIPNGQTTGSVTFTVVDDAVVEGTETATLTITNPSAGITLGNTTSQNISISDNDTAGVTISQSGDSTDLTEGSATD